MNTIRTDDQLREIARGGIERHLGDVVDEDHSPDDIYDEAYTLAHDALIAAGVDYDTARRVSQQVAMEIAQP